MKTEFTPGPWSAYTQTFPHEVLIYTIGPCANYDSPVVEQIAWTPKNPYIVGTESHDAFKAKSRANAQLMARAPSLLGALVSLEAALRERDKLPEDKGGLGYYGNLAMRNAREEIARARGETLLDCFPELKRVDA